MGTWRRPKGSVTRPIPDWQLRNMAAGGITGRTGAGTFEDLGLFNDSTDGSYLVLWDVLITVGAPQNANPSLPSVIGKLIAGSEGISTTGLSQPRGYPLVGASGSPPGAFWDNLTPSGLTTPAYQFMDDARVWQWQHDWPFAAIPPRFSYVVELFGDTSGWSFSCVWEATRDI
jgi:hypothetical protein